MPIGRYVIWAGTLLVALLFLLDWLVPKPMPDPAAARTMDKPVIRIASVEQPPEPIVIDTSQPTIVPPPMLVEDVVQSQLSPLQSYAAATLPAAPIEVEKKGRKAVKRQVPKIAGKQPALPRSPSTPKGISSATVSTTTSTFADLISGRLVRSLFGLH
jgi:hypothetical protein